MSRIKKCPVCGESLFVIDGKNRCLNFPIKCQFQQEIDSINYHDYIVFDFETTGLNPTTNKIIQAAAVRVKNGIIVDSFNKLINPHKLVSSNITDLTGITNEMLIDKEDENVVIKEFVNWCSKENVQYFVAHNGMFDVNFLKSSCRRIGKLTMPIHCLIDSEIIAKAVFPKGNGDGVDNYKQITLAKHYGIEYDAHRADEDVMALQKIFELLCDDCKRLNINEMNFRKFI